jgi:NADPH2:quinone reductase
MTAQLSKAIRIDHHGGPEQLKLVQVDGGRARPGRDSHPPPRGGPELYRRVPAQRAVPLPLPLQLGMEAAGVVEAVGEGVTHLQAG